MKDGPGTGPGGAIRAWLAGTPPDNLAARPQRGEQTFGFQGEPDTSMIIQSLEEIRRIIGTPNPILDKKIYRYLNPRMERFIEHSPVVFIATVDVDGFPTISPKGDAAGFVKIEDAETLLIPERKGNKLAYTFQNILAGSKVALLFVVPGTNEVLRVHGTAVIEWDESLNARLASESHDALVVTRLTVNSCYFHCGKAFLRSRLFSKDTVLRDMGVSFGEELARNAALETEQVQDFDEGVVNRYKTDL